MPRAHVDAMKGNIRAFLEQAPRRGHRNENPIPPHSGHGMTLRNVDVEAAATTARYG